MGKTHYELEKIGLQIKEYRIKKPSMHTLIYYKYAQEDLLLNLYWVTYT